MPAGGSLSLSTNHPTPQTVSRQEQNRAATGATTLPFLALSGQLRCAYSRFQERLVNDNDGPASGMITLLNDICVSDRGYGAELWHV